MDLRIASTVYDEGLRPWVNDRRDLENYKRAFQSGNGETRRIAQAMISQNPVTPRQEIQQNMTTRKLPNRYGYDKKQPNIMQILEGTRDPDTGSTEWNDFSGSKGEIDSTLRYSGMWF